jgi:anti-sigma-K factor RskA
MCCAITALLLAVAAGLRGVVKSTFARLPWARWALASLAIVLALAGGTALAARQFDHTSPQSDLAAVLAQHICGIGFLTPHHAR